MESSNDIQDINDMMQSSVHHLREVQPFAELRGNSFSHHSLIQPSISEHQNSVDCICANPKNPNEFATGSHDRSIKIWDLSSLKSIKTLTGHGEGVWCLNYNKDGSQFVTASPEGIAKIWDPKSGKSVTDLKAHSKRVYWATYNNASNQIATCGSDKMVYLWDLRKSPKPIAENNQNESMVLQVDFFPDDQYLVSTNLEGDVSIISMQDNMSIIKHETLESHQKTNTAFCCTTVKNSPAEAGMFLVGSENKLVTKFNFYQRELQIEKIGTYHGHSNSIRNVQVSKDCKSMLSCCEDHSLRLWDYQTLEPQIIFTGHRDLVSGAAYIDSNTIVSSSWDLRVMVWKF